MISTTLLLASLTIPTESSQAPYSIALEFCAQKDVKVALYSPQQDRVEFSCSDAPHKTYVIIKED